VADEESKEVEEQEASAEDSKEKKGPNLKKPLMMLGIVVVQAVLAFVVAQFVILPRLPVDPAEADSTAVAEEEVVPERERGSIVMMDDIVVNLRDTEGSRFLKVSTGLEFTEKKLEQEIGERMPELRDVLIGHLSSHMVEDMVHREGREVVKQQVLDDFNQTLQAGKLINIYFSDFVVQ